MLPTRKTDFWSALFLRLVKRRAKRSFKKVDIMPFEPKPGHAVLMLCNHFSWWETILTNMSAADSLKRRWHGMMQQEQAEKHWYLRYIGLFSIKKGSRELLASLAYAARLLEDPANMVVVCPQGEIRSNHETHINIEKGVQKLIEQIKTPCQVVYHCILIDYFESFKPSAYIHQFDCGVAGECTFEELKQRVNNFHQQALQNQINMKH
ncbi:lysophospholipid acyltransferase family protein [Mucilaginibacter dorajii]|uniref:Phospholipid/glycerol acyltransferase domain-containing protein n=1 Tax=Mucilaginibacter dorajii TaxID=692994 RepID=A0ABP7PYA6_9SPHI|nr:lysophospholipid acyltransferase family protein [Mucilaginibacter dorajii]MCS3736478.1 1-acyl-sn-glycerol-3-phosphate acyltransferase [Mucilaginibacter dorajii]